MLEEALPMKTIPDTELTKEELAKQEENIKEYLFDTGSLKGAF